MNDSSADMLDPRALARMLDLDAGGGWSQDDAAAALRHQIGAPLLADLARVPGVEIERLGVLAGPGATFLGAVLARVPALELLEGIKQWARLVREDRDSPLAGGPATVLYYAAIAAAQVRLGQRLTALSEEQLRAGMAWARAFPGGEALGCLFDQAMV